jgi:hypothetical protein
MSIWGLALGKSWGGFCDELPREVSRSRSSIKMINISK